MEKAIAPGRGGGAQFRREAAKARQLADAAFGEKEWRNLLEVAAPLDREASEIDFSLARGQGCST